MQCNMNAITDICHDSGKRYLLDIFCRCQSSRKRCEFGKCDCQMGPPQSMDFRQASLFLSTFLPQNNENTNFPNLNFSIKI